ncbi:Retinol dehydrogenase 13 [Mycena kentingensis (nom. inval.)]|nr:Retinol dehydrogenase 13 [Mycena kentingensis (nom. inval.)]
MGVFDMIKVSLFGASNNGGIPFNPATDIPSLEDKVILVTGGAGGVGRESVLEFARHNPKHVYVADLPQKDNGAALLEGIRASVPDASVSFLPLDLGSFDAIQKMVEALKNTERLDICLLNAGVMPVKPSTTKEGYETAFGINYLGHCLLARLLMPKLLHTATLPGADVRLVFVSSEGHKMAPKGGIQFGKLKTPCQELKYYQRYGQSKLCVNLLVRELAAKHPEIKVSAVHPGRIATGLANELVAQSLLVRLTKPLGPLLTVPPPQGARNSLWASTSPAVVSGKYYEPVGVADKESKLSRDEKLGKRLREWTEEELKGHLWLATALSLPISRQNRAVSSTAQFPPSRLVHLSNLPWDVSELAVREAMNHFGEIDGVRIRLSTEGTVRGFGSVLFRTLEAAHGACDAEVHISGRRVYTAFLDPKFMVGASKLPDSPRSSIIFVGNLHPATNREMLHEKFASFGPIQQVQLPLCPGPTTTYARVHFRRTEDAIALYEYYRHEPLIMLNFTVVIAYSNRNAMVSPERFNPVNQPILPKPMRAKPPRPIVAPRPTMPDGLTRTSQFTPSKLLLVLNLPYKMSLDGDGLRKLFARYGPVVRVRLIYDEHGFFEGRAFVLYEELADAVAAFNHNDFKVDGRQLTVDYSSRPPKTSKFPPSKQLHVRNIPYEAKEADVRKELKRYGRMENVRLMFDKDKTNRGYGYVRFATLEAATAVFENPEISILDRIVQTDYSEELSDDTERHAPTRTLFVGNVPLEVTAKQFRQYFRQLGRPLVAARLGAHDPRLAAKYGHLDFVSVEDAVKVYERVQAGKLKLAIEGQRLNLQYSKPRVHDQAMLLTRHNPTNYTRNCRLQGMF